MGKQRTDAEQSAIEHGGDSAPVGGARLRPMQEVIRNSPRLKSRGRGGESGGVFMADPPGKAMANRSKDRRKSTTPKSTTKSNAKGEKNNNAREKNVVKDEDSEESNIDDRGNDENEEEDEDDMDSDDVEEESGQEEVLGEGMFEVEAIRKKRIRKVRLFCCVGFPHGSKKLSATHFVQPADRNFITFLVSIRLLGFTLKQ